MKTIIKNKFNSLKIVVPFIMILLSAGMANSQNTEQNTQQNRVNAQRFVDLDTNNDGFIGQNEFQFGSFNDFDVDKNGKLSHNEFRKYNRSIQRNAQSNAKPMNGSGNANGQGNQNAKGKNNGMKQNNRKGTGVCPNGNVPAKKKNFAKKGGRNS